MSQLLTDEQYNTRRRSSPQLLNDEQYNGKTASAATRRQTPQLLNNEQYNTGRRSSPQVLNDEPYNLFTSRGREVVFELQHELHKSAQFTGVTAQFTGVNTANEAHKYSTAQQMIADYTSKPL